MDKRPLFLASCYCLSALTHANNDDLLALSIEDLLEVKVSVSSRYDERLKQAPSSVTVLTADEINILGLTTLEELLNYVSGVQYSRAGYQSKITFRGRHANNADILVLLDGMRLNDPVSASAFLAFQYIDLSAIERVEVIKGPGSAMYGSNAYNGVISLTTRSEGKKMAAYLGSAERREANINYHQAGDQWRLGVNAGVYADEGEYYPAFFNFFGVEEPTRDPREGHHLYFSGSYENFYFKAGVHQRRSEDFVWSSQGNGINHQEGKSHFYQLAYQGNLSAKVNFNITLEQMTSDQSALLLLTPASVSSGVWTDGSVADYIGGNYREVEARRATFNGAWQQSSQASLLFGLEYRKELTKVIDFQGNWDEESNRESLGFVLTPRTEPGYSHGFWYLGSYHPLVPEVSRDIKSAYLQQNYAFNEQWTLTVGAHYDNYSDVGNNTSIRSALVFHASKATTFKLLYGEAFRAPSLYELNALIATGLIGNSELRPETVKTLDLIWQQKYHDVAWSLTYYYSDFADVIENVLVDDIISGFSSYQPQNYGSVILSGWELDLKATLDQHWSLSLNSSTADRYDELGAARTMAALTLRYQHERWQIGAGGVYHSSVLSRVATETAPAIELSDYWLAKLHFSYQWSKEVSLSASIDNAFDQAYVGYNEAAGTELGIPARGRQVSVQFEYHW